MTVTPTSLPTSLVDKQPGMLDDQEEAWAAINAMTAAWDDVGGTGGGSTIASNTYTSSRVLTEENAGRCVEMNSASATTVTIPGSPIILTETFPGADNAAWPTATWTGPANPTNQKQLGGKGQLIPGNTAYASSGGIVASGIASLTDVEFVGEAYFDTATTNEQYMWIGWRTDGTETGGQLTNGYNIDWNPATNTYSVRKHVAGVTTDLATGIAHTYNGGARFKVQHVQGTLKVKVWPVASAEPAGWDYETTEGTPYLGSNKVTLKATNGNSTTPRTMSFDNLTVADLSVATTEFPVGTVISIYRMGTGSVTVLAGTGTTLRTASSATLRAQYSEATIRQRAIGEWVLSGDLT